MRRALLPVVAAAALLAAGCSGDANTADGGETPSAGSFVGCFDLAGFEAKVPPPREESILAFQAKRSGYEVEPVNVSKNGMLTPHAFLVFFESEERAKQAIADLKATSLGEVPPQQRKNVVIGYGDEENRRTVEPAINRCVPQ